MPAGDRTGPLGYGPMTGRGAGFCTGNSVPGYANYSRGYGGGFGAGYGCGGGRGRRNRFFQNSVPYGTPWNYPPPYNYGSSQPELTPESEMKMLKAQAELMQKEVSTIIPYALFKTSPHHRFWTPGNRQKLRGCTQRKLHLPQ